MLTRKQYLFVLALMTVSCLLGVILSGAIARVQSSRTQQTAQATLPPVQKSQYKLLVGNPQGLGNDLEFLTNQGFDVAGFAATADQTGQVSVTLLLKRSKP
jgi:hypothetical protein